MLCLGVDTVSAKASVALLDGDTGNTLAEVTLPAGRGQSAALLTGVDTVLSDSGYNFKDLEQLMVMTGPGSFTGIRVGLSFLKGVALSLDIPLSGMNHFEVIAHSQKDTNEDYLIALEAGRGEKFFHFARDSALIAEPLNCDFEMLISEYNAQIQACRKVISDFAPDTAPFDIEWHELKHTTSRQLILAAIQKGIEFPESPMPYYIRPADTTESKK
ncbi:MAG: tRNA (adenosine(37)-N6)-threonylcarbamoyltransferase complex dimerization subunit type 1 TsaB [Pseudomonadota bacterium]